MASVEVCVTGFDLLLKKIILIFFTYMCIYVQRV